MIDKACQVSNIPIIALGGAKNAKDLEKAIKISELSAVAAANFFHYTEHSGTIAKSFIKRENQYPIRLETHVDYKETKFDEDTRILKKEDDVLASLMFETHEKEVI